MTLINPILSEWKYVGLELRHINDISHLSISHLKSLLTLIMTGEVISDPN